MSKVREIVRSTQFKKKPDWLLIYEKPKGQLILVLARTGSHSELF